ncbi:homoserine dehydrogenase [Aminicella lysinilytica]|uniref:homoserine dehydrogenase n=1 Tax=Aminicella lysinilytica TaxID=433323 RepID=UPI0026F1F2F5|nr:homoserine dehydrogenase [Aminicella lysinilytica]
MRNVKVAMLGFGNAGQAFAKMLWDKESDIEKRYGCGVIVTAISTRTKGTIINDDGIDLVKACDDIKACGHFAEDTTGLCNASDFEVIRSADYDVICELTPLEIKTGQPAIDHIREAFVHGSHVITANKGPIAWAYRELADMARTKGLMFFYETTVMDGTPVFNLVDHDLKLCRVTEVSGILNSTTNYILEEMAAGRDYDAIIAEGKRRGFIEEDPAMDIEGFDAAAKITALLNVLMDAGITPDQVDRKGIENITLEDIKAAEEDGKVIKLLCRGTVEGGKVKATVGPQLVDKGDMLATIDSTTSIVSITTDLMGKVSIVEHAPEIEQTAYGIFGDLLRVMEGLVR